MNINFTKNISKKYIYEYYIIGRQKAIFHNSLTALNTQLDKFIYSDLIESLFSTNFNNYKYFIIFKNNFIFYSKVYYIRYKSEIFAIFLRFKIYLKSLSFRIYRIRLNNKKEYIFKIFLVYLA